MKIVFAMLLYSVTSCSEKIDIDVPLAGEKVVVNGLLTPGDSLLVYVSQTQAFDSIENIFNENLNIELWKDNEFVETLQNTSVGYYKSQNCIQPDNNYTIKFDSEKFGSVTATDYVPDSVKIISGTYIEDTYWNSHVGDDMIELTINFKDPPNKTNYYEIAIFGFLDYSSKYTQVYALSSKDYAFVVEGDMDYLDVDASCLLFRDTYLDENVTLTFECAFMSWGSSGGPLFAVLRNVSENYYNYKKSWIRHNYNQGLNSPDLDEIANIYTAGNPVSMYTNINNGLGIVASYSATKLELTKVNK